MYLHRKRRFTRRRKKRATAVACAFVALLVLFVAVINPRLKSIVRVYARSIAERMCYDAINSAADTAVEQSAVAYNDIVKIERNADDEITAVIADISCVNKIKTKTTAALSQALAEVSTEQICIPVGTITGSSIFVGRGPDIKVKTQLTGSSEVQIRSDFESAGINQTRHIIVMEITCRVYIVMLGEESVQEISLTVPIAETLIVGAVPDTFLELYNNAAND